MDVIFLFEHAQLNLPGIISMGHRSLQAVWKGGGCLLLGIRREVVSPRVEIGHRQSSKKL